MLVSDSDEQTMSAAESVASFYIDTSPNVWCLIDQPKF